METMAFVRYSKVTASDGLPLIYIPKEAQRILGIRKGDWVAIFVDPRSKTLLIKKQTGE